MQAAIGSAQMDKLERFILRRKENFLAWQRIFQKHTEYFIFEKPTQGSDPAWFAYVVTLSEKAPFTRDEFVRELNENLIETRCLFAGNMIRQPFFEVQKYRLADHLRNTDYIVNNTFFSWHISRADRRDACLERKGHCRIYAAKSEGVAMPLVKKYPSRVTKMENPLEGLYDLAIESLSRPYTYLPGQFLHLALDPYNPSSPWPESRCFSMRSAAASGHIRLTFAVKGSFTRRMAAELVSGKEIVVKLPYGELFSKERDRARSVFIAGGTGVVPFLSLFADPSFDGYETPSLWLGIREERYHIYDAELQDAQKRNAGFHVSTVCQDREGVLDIEKILSVHGQDATYFISGPPIMIANFKNYLLEHGFAPEQVCTDDWE